MSRANKTWIRPIALYKDLDTGQFSVLAEFKTIFKHKTDHLLIPRSQFSDPRGARRLLDDRGADLPPTWTDDVRAVLNWKSGPVIETTSTLGWVKPGIFLLPDAAIGGRGKVAPKAPADRTACVHGRFEAWKQGIKNPIAGSSYLLFSTAAALAGPLLRPVGHDESSIFHLFGMSSTGKSLAAVVAQSCVEQAGRERLQTHDLTSRSLEELAAGCNDGLVILDEIGRANLTGGHLRRHLKDLAFKLSGGQGRRRSQKATSDESLRNLSFRVIGLSSGEDPLDGGVAPDRYEGEQVRFIGIPVGQPEAGGIFDLEPDGARRAKLAAKAEETIRAHYGHAIRRFLKAYLADHEAANRAIAHQTAFVRRVVKAPHPFAARFAGKFGLVYAAAMLAVDYGIAPWTKKQAGKAIRKVYRLAWNQVRPPECAVEDLLAWLARNADNERRFPVVEKREKAPPRRPPRAYGIRRTMNGTPVVALLRHRLHDKLSLAEANDVLPILSQRGLILPGKEQGRHVRQLRIGKERLDFILFDHNMLKSHRAAAQDRQASGTPNEGGSPPAD